MTPNSSHPASHVAARAVIAIGACLGTAVALITVVAGAVADATGPAPRPESGIVALLGLSGLAVLAHLAVTVVRVALPAVADLRAGRTPSTRHRVRGIERVVVGLVLGAGALAPQAAGAATVGQARTAGATAAMATVTTTPFVETSVDIPVDPAYVSDAATDPSTSPGPQAPASAPRPDAGTPQLHHETTDDGRRQHVVRTGDTLWQIAATALGPQADDAAVARAVNAVYAANHAAIGSDPDRIDVGTRLVLPSTIGAPR